MKKKLIALLMAIGIGVFAMSVNAEAGSCAYRLTTNICVTKYVNSTGKTRTLNLHTRPSSGTGGAYVSVRSNNGVTVFAGKTFSYYTSTSALSVSVPNGVTRSIYIAPAQSGQTVAGTLSIYAN